MRLPVQDSHRESKKMPLIMSGESFGRYIYGIRPSHRVLSRPVHLASPRRLEDVWLHVTLDAGRSLTVLLEILKMPKVTIHDLPQDVNEYRFTRRAFAVRVGSRRGTSTRQDCRGYGTGRGEAGIPTPIHYGYSYCVGKTEFMALQRFGRSGSPSLQKPNRNCFLNRNAMRLRDYRNSLGSQNASGLSLPRGMSRCRGSSPFRIFPTIG